MTTIAWDGRYLAADTLGHRNGVPSNMEARKLGINGNFAYAINGQLGPMLPALMQWHAEGHVPADFPKPGEGQMLVVDMSDRRCWVVTHTMPYFDEEAAPFHGGSGGDVALGVMHAGLTAMEAVLIASRCDVHTSDVIDFIDTQRPEYGIQRWDGVMPSSKFPMPEILSAVA